jgi:ribosomal protein S18 acetylase RimI-like enzyme
MSDADLVAADQVWLDAFATSTEFSRSATPRTDSELQADLARRSYLLRGDPDGSFVAVADGSVVGLAQSHRREGTFVLAKLAVAPGFQDRGIGKALLDQVLSYAEGCRAAYIFSSVDPRAIHRYISAGFKLRPAVRITPRPSDPGPVPPEIRLSDGNAEDLGRVEAIDRRVRGSARTSDVELWLSGGAALVIDDRGGYVVLGPNRITALAALDEQIARDLIGVALEGFPDGILRSGSWIAGDQHWAIEEAAKRHAEIEVHGAVMTRGVSELPYPYLPNGLFG